MIGNVLTQESIVLAMGGVTAHGIAQTTRREDYRDATTSRKGTAKNNTASFDFKAPAADAQHGLEGDGEHRVSRGSPRSEGIISARMRQSREPSVMKLRRD
jgi:hypothetical protein